MLMATPTGCKEGEKPLPFGTVQSVGPGIVLLVFALRAGTLWKKYKNTIIHLNTSLMKAT